MKETKSITLEASITASPVKTYRTGSLLGKKSEGGEG